jgi:carboxymethylenebutenolidase
MAREYTGGVTEDEDAFGFWVRAGGARSDAPGPGAVMIPDVWGVSDLYRGLARRLAGEGLTTLVVDPYRKTGRRQLTDVASALAWIAELSDPLVIETVQEAIDRVAADDSVAGRRVGVVGFCMGGQYALLAACECRGLSACAPFYGMVRYPPGADPLRKPRSPLEALASLSCPVLGFYGAQDAIIPVADVRELEARLERSNQAGEIRLYEDAGHAFMNDTRPEMYRPDAARDAWPRLVAFLRETLVD